MTQENIKIIGGPGKFDLMLGLFEGKTVIFTLESPAKCTVEVRLSSIERGDGSSENWNLSGYSIVEFNSGPRPVKKIKAYYATRGNHGTLNFLEE